MADETLTSFKQLERIITKEGPMICEWLTCPVCKYQELMIHPFRERVGLDCGHAAATTWERAFAALGNSGE